MIAERTKAVLGPLLGERGLDAVRRAWHHLRASDPRLAARHRQFVRANAALPADEIEIRPGIRLSIDPGARHGFEHFCFRSLEMAQELDGFLAWCRVTRPKRRLLDVGALHGIFALAFSAGRAGAAALALEPSPLAFPVLAENVRRNPGADVRALQTAAGAAPATIAMRLDWHHLEACGEDEIGEPGVLAIPVRPLDEICAEQGFAPDVMKVDVEGYEVATLCGAERLLAEERPDLFLEAHPLHLERLGSSMAELFGLMVDRCYEVFDHRGRPVRATAFSRLRAVTRFRCVPVERARGNR